MKQQSRQRPNQQSGNMQGTIPVSRAANLFLLSALGLFGICVCILVAVIGTREFHLIQQTEQQKRVDLLGDGVKTYVDHRLDILYDQAEFSSIKQAVMQPKTRKADITDFMSILSILTTKPQMVLLDFAGAQIHRTRETPDVDFTGYPWVSRLIDGTQSRYAGILQLPGGPHWCIAVPVLYHGRPEGILTTVIPLQNMIKSSHLSNITNTEELKILQKGTVLARFGAENAAGPTQKTVLDRFNLTLQYTGQATQISTARNRLILMIIGILLLMSLPIALAMFVMARKWFVKPLQQLRDATYSISNKTGKALFTEQEWRIQEIALLRKDLKVMAKQVDDRESKLEKLVQERTGELKTQKERLNNILEGTNVGTWEWNVQTGATIFNEKWANIIGYTLNEISPVSIETWMKFAHPDDLKKSDELLEKHFNGELDYYHFESRMKHKDASWIWVLNRGKVITWNEEGKPLWVFGTHQDITDRKQAEKEQELSQIQKAESLGRMAGSIAHHFNNQLSVVMGNLELVLGDLPDDADNREFLVQSFEAGRKATKVSQQMLHYLGHISDSKTTINLSDVCRQSLAFLQSASSSGVTFNVDFPDPGPFVHADAGQIQQVLTNLLSNAQESLPDNKGIIGLIIQTVSHEDISTSNRFPLDWHPQDNPYACLGISDTGHGVSKEDIEKLFDPFYTTKFTGRGMGLPVTMGILKTQNGCITVDSESETGTVFRVYLPVSTEQKPVKHEKATTPKGKVGNGGTVLLVEDEASVRNMAEKMISRLGYKIIEAQDGFEALTLFQEHQNEIDCVLSDLTMPRMNGWETLTALREKGADVPVILASGYDKDTVMAGDHPELPQGFLNKPYSMAELKDVLMEVIRL